MHSLNLNCLKQDPATTETCGRLINLLYCITTFAINVYNIWPLPVHDTLLHHIDLYFIRCNQSSCRVCNGAHPSHSSTLHFCAVVFARYLPEMCAARHDMVQIACGCAAHTVFVLTVAPQMFRCRGGSLSRAHSVGRPPCTPRQCVTTRELFFWMDVIFLQVALGSLLLMLPLRDTSFCGLTQERLGG